MYGKEATKPIIVQKNFNVKGGLKSIYQFIDRNAKRDKKYFYIPKWLFISCTSIITFVFLIQLVGIIILAMAKRHGLYGENCVARSCNNNIGLKCINQTCQCEPGYFYIDKCTLKREYFEKCFFTSDCKDAAKMTCTNGVCSCNSTQFWNGRSCVNQITFEKTCSNSSQCHTNLLLYCNTAQGICTCPANRYTAF